MVQAYLGHELYEVYASAMANKRCVHVFLGRIPYSIHCPVFRVTCFCKALHVWAKQLLAKG